ncbi:MAG TPA: DsbA family oxidoreductase [Cellulomonas sp.]|uniref:DsbA family oxidoreductase n=1 Tax=Cellulomonas sp. TaxID=40001 RepID=UPI002E33AD9F|nr:DsbA family oxidoreductase [Cellulomonas sp.]HEX5334136.1 DsbA family oxidoreductase [Cellulomonas sp.]
MDTAETRPATETSPVDVHVWSDVACPWCFVGKRRFESAVRDFGGEVTVEYHSFELSPDTPVDFEGSEVDFLASHKGMPAVKVAQMLGRMAELAAAEGLSYDFDAVRHTKTLLAHQAMHHAKAEGKQLQLVERLFRAYFEEGRHVGHVDELVTLGAEVGLDEGTMRQVLTDGTYADAVQDDIALAQEIGISGVPFFVIGGRYAVSGAQSPEVFATALERAARDAVVEASAVESRVVEQSR